MCTRPEISFIFSRISQSLANHQTGDLIAAECVLRYLKGTEFCFRKSKEGLGIIALSDSDWTPGTAALLVIVSV